MVAADLPQLIRWIEPLVPSNSSMAGYSRPGLSLRSCAIECNRHGFGLGMHTYLREVEESLWPVK
jgi:hypothetical protein